MIYTDKLPENCEKCKLLVDTGCDCHDGNGDCCVGVDKEYSFDYGRKVEDTSIRPDWCPLKLIEQWRLESCHTCSVENCLTYRDTNNTMVCSGWQPIEPKVQE